MTLRSEQVVWWNFQESIIVKRTKCSKPTYASIYFSLSFTNQKNFEKWATAEVTRVIYGKGRVYRGG